MTVTQISDQMFEKEVLEASHQKPVLLKFWAPWCGPCKMLAPLVKEVADEGKYQMLYTELNADENQIIPAKFGVRGLPTMLIFSKGHVVAQKVGMLAKTQLVSWIEATLTDVENRANAE